jgi:hypothetical protein
MAWVRLLNGVLTRAGIVPEGSVISVAPDEAAHLVALGAAEIEPLSPAASASPAGDDAAGGAPPAPPAAPARRGRAR